jgi:hypothetical protein
VSDDAQSVALMGTGKVFLAFLLALGITLVGAWAAAVSYAGPAYGYAIDNAGAWQETNNRLVLHLVPGAVAALSGLMLLFTVGSARSGRGRFWTGLFALLVMAAGVWLVIGRGALASYNGSSSVSTIPGSPGWAFELRMIHEWGPGLLLAIFGAWSLGLQAVSRRLRPVY